MVERKTSAKGAAKSDVDDYLAGLPKDMRATLEKLRRLIKSVAPKADEVISYQIPAFKYHGPLVGFAAFKKHYSLFLMNGSFVKEHPDELEDYETTKSAIHFPPDRPLPTALLKRIIRERMTENEARALTRDVSRTAKPKKGPKKKSRKQ